MHMNLSAEKFMKRVVGREEKKEDPDTLLSDEDWLDDVVSTEGKAQHIL